MKSDSILALDETAADAVFRITPQHLGNGLSVRANTPQSSGRTDNGTIDRMPVLHGLKLDRSIALMSGRGEYEQLQAQHGEFAQKKLNGSLSSREEKEYAMVLWNLDRIEDAQMGESLDVLESLVQGHERFEAKIKQLYSYFSNAIGNSGSGGKRRGY